MTDWKARAAQWVDLILFRAYCDLKVEASRAYLGFLWWFIEPILFMGVFYVVFGLVIDLAIENFVSFLLVGLVAWRWFAGAVTQSVPAIIQNGGLINQVYVPKFVFPLVVVAMHTFKFLIVFALLLAFLAIAGAPLGSSLLWLPLLIALSLALTLSCCILVAAIYPLFPDVKVIVDSGLLLMFFLSGVFFKAREALAVAPLFDYNPMAVLIAAYRDVLLYEAAPPADGLLMVCGSAIALFLIGFTIIHRYDRLYVKLSNS